MANIAFQLKDSNLYQNGKLYFLGDVDKILKDGSSLVETDEVLLLREPLEKKQEQGDSFMDVTEGDELGLLAYHYYKGLVENANQYWWLIADRNEFFDPLEMTLIVDDGDLVSASGVEIVIPNILKQQPQF